MTEEEGFEFLSGPPRNLKEAISYGIGASPDSPRVEFIEANVRHFLLRQGLCASCTDNLQLIQNKTKQEAEV